MKRSAYILVFAMLIVMAFTSCIDDNEYGKGIGHGIGKTAEISFLATTPPTTQISTRGQTGTVSENQINDIYVLVFDKSTEELVLKTKGKSLSVAQGAVNNNKVTFKATLPVGTEYTFMVLANAQSKLGSIEIGQNPAKKKSDILALTISNSDKWDDTAPPVPMWGEQDLNLTVSSTPSFDLARMLARVNVEVNLRDINNTPVDNFELTSVRYYNYNTIGTLVPSEGNYDFATNTATHPTIPGDPETETGSALVYDNNGSNNYIDDGRSCKEKIYIFEAAHNNNTYNSPPDNTDWINNPCLVIGGRYTTPEGTQLNETFYRIDFIRKDKSDPNASDIWLSILRNFSYNVTIVEVNGSGFPDPDVALRSAPINMEANILEWNESDMGDIVFDGVFFLSVSRDKLSVVSSAVDEEKEENLLYIKTDYTYDNDPSHTSSGWYVEKYVDKDTGDPVTWLQLNPDKAAPDADKPVKTYFTFEANNTGNIRTAIVWIAAGRLRYPVEVTQNLAWVRIVDPVDESVTIDELRFEVPIGGSPQETQKFRVLWGPSDIFDAVIGQNSRYDWSAFEPHYISPSPSPSWTLSGNGKQDFTVNAPEVDQNAIAQDPLYEKESTYSFTVGTGQDTQTASIILHQIHYNIVVDMHNYKLDGGSHYLTVRSNTEWEIESVEEWLSNLPPSTNNQSPVLLDLRSTDNLRVGAKGGPNQDGEPVYFKTVNERLPLHEGKWGTVRVKFKSPMGKFNPVEVIIRFHPINDGEFTILGLGYGRDVRNYNTAFTISSHNQGLGRMINSKWNFGDYPESTVQTGNINLLGYNCMAESKIPPIGNEEAYDWRRYDLEKWLNDHNPDLITIAYSMILRDEEEDLLFQYLDNGGVVIMHYGEGTAQPLAAVQKFIRRLFGIEVPPLGSKVIQHGVTGYGEVFQLPGGDEFANDPILNGPFGDMRGGYYGMNAIHYSIDLSEVENQIIDYTGTLINKTIPERNKTTVFRLKDKHLFFIANGGGSGSYYPAMGDYYCYNDVNRNDEVYFRPILRQGFGPSGSNPASRHAVCNAIVYMNAVAWALNVSDHKRPAGGYVTPTY